MAAITRKALVVGILASVLGGAAQANTVTYTGGFSGLTDVTSQDIQVRQFDSSMGVLQSALFVLTARTEISAFAQNDGNFLAVWDIYRDQFSLTGAVGYSNIALTASLAPTRVVGMGSADINTLSTFTAGQQITSASPYEHYTGQGLTTSGSLVKFYEWDYAGPTLSASQSFSTAAQAAYVGTGNLDFLLTTLNREGLSMGGLQTQGLPSPAWSGTHADVVASVSVTYDYLPAVAASDAAHVPEPVPYALIGTGLGMVGMSRRGRPGRRAAAA